MPIKKLFNLRIDNPGKMVSGTNGQNVFGRQSEI